MDHIWNNGVDLITYDSKEGHSLESKMTEYGFMVKVVNPEGRIFMFRDTKGKIVIINPPNDLTVIREGKKYSKKDKKLSTIYSDEYRRNLETRSASN